MKTSDKKITESKNQQNTISDIRKFKLNSKSMRGKIGGFAERVTINMRYWCFIVLFTKGISLTSC